MTESEKRAGEWADAVFEEGHKPCEYKRVELDPFKPYIYAFQSFRDNYFVEISCEGYDPFYAYFQPCFNRAAPLIVHTPGYGGEMSMHPELANEFHVLHVNPLGYSTPAGKDFSKLPIGGMLGRVFPDTVLTRGRGGYFKWFANVVMAVLWAWKQPDVAPGRVSFFGTSQGGGASLVLGSVFQGRGVRCVAADQPYLTDFPYLKKVHSGTIFGADLFKDVPEQEADEAMALVDSINHAHRLNVPVLVSTGGRDTAIPAETSEHLYSLLRGSRAFVRFEKVEHGYNREFIEMARGWFRVFA